MTEVLKMIASGIAAIGTPVARKDYPKLDKMPFTSDRLRLRGDLNFHAEITLTPTAPSSAA